MMLNKGGDDDAKKSGAKEQLAENLQEQSKLKKQVKDLSDEAKSDRQIAASAALVSNETESPAMGHMLGAMWKDMRMLDLLSFAWVLPLFFFCVRSISTFLARQ